ncbi:MAG: DUF1294 domain-containing protein [Clostridia bacterium]|nr:DUF1294 domain-containing protein [Clostridia bacterium]
MIENYFALFVIWNVAVFALYGIDKWCAVNDKWRISEKTLIGSAFFMGSLGAILGMKTFRHKTRKKMFQALIGVAFLVNAAVLFLIERI